MKTRITIFLLICGMLFTGCANSTPEQSRDGQSDTAAKNIKTQQTESGGETSNIGEAQNAQNSAENIYPPFTGIEISEKGMTVSTLNNMTGGRRLFCYNEDTVYFSNPQDQYRLYSYDGENAKCLTDLQTDELYCLDGSVYFLNRPMPKKDRATGIIYRYDIESGETVQLFDENVYNLRVDDSGVYYMQYGEDDSYIYRLDPESGKGEQLYKGLIAYNLDDCVITSEGNLDNQYRDYFIEKDGEKVCILSNADIADDFVHNGVFYFWDYEQSRRYSLDLRTGEKDSTYTAVPKTVGEVNLTDGCTFFDGYTYLLTNLDIYRMKDAISEQIKVKGNHIIIGYYDGYFDDNPIYKICSLYTDNKSLYALVAPTNEQQKYYMAKLETEEYEVSGEIMELTSIIPIPF